MSLPEQHEQKGPGFANKRNRAQKEADMLLVAEKMVAGWTQQEIADYIATVRPCAISRSQVKQDVKKLHVEWLKLRVDSVDFHKNKQLAEIALLKRKAWARIDESTRAKKKSKQGYTEQGRGAGTAGQRNFASVEDEERNGDPRWHLVVLKCLESERAVLGINQRIPDATPDGVIDPDTVFTPADNARVMRETIRTELLKEQGLLPWMQPANASHNGNGNGNGHHNGNGHANGV